METDNPVDLSEQRKLSKAIDKLAAEESPKRDLWPEIEARLNNHETKVYNRRWMPFALAVSVLISSISMWFAWSSYLTSQALIASTQKQQTVGPFENIQKQIEVMERDYGLAKSALLAQIGMNSTPNTVDLLIDVNANLIIIEQATSELKAAIMKEPGNPGLLKLLNATYQQELVVLSQLAKLNQDT